MKKTMIIIILFLTTLLLQACQNSDSHYYVSITRNDIFEIIPTYPSSENMLWSIDTTKNTLVDAIHNSLFGNMSLGERVWFDINGVIIQMRTFINDADRRWDRYIRLSDLARRLPEYVEVNRLA